MNADALLLMLERNGFDFFTGVPCSYLKNLCRILQTRDSTFHQPAPREDIALGLAAGAYMGGKLPVVYMQNSGLGYSLEVLASLHLIYGIPVLILLTYRGLGEDAGWEEHQVMGRHTEDILRTFGIRYSELDDQFDEDHLRDIRKFLVREQNPYCLLVDKEAIT